MIAIRKTNWVGLYQFEQFRIDFCIERTKHKSIKKIIRCKKKHRKKSKREKHKDAYNTSKR